MKKYLFIFATAVLALASCSNDNELTNESGEKVNGMPLSFSVSIAKPAGTRTAYTWDGENKIIKAAWEAGDKISLVTYTAENKVATNDIFTTTGSGDEATFSGTYTGDPSATLIRVVYPALNNGTSNTIAQEDGYKGVTPFRMSTESEYCNFDFSNVQQKADDDMSLLNKYNLMFGKIADLQNPSVTLNHFTSVFRVEINTEHMNAARSLKQVSVETGAGNPFGQSGSTWDYAKITRFNGDTDYTYFEYASLSNSAKVYLGNWDNNQGYYGIPKDGDGKIVVYIPFWCTNTTIDLNLMVTLTMDDYTSLQDAINRKPTQITFSPGKVYNLKVHP